MFFQCPLTGQFCLYPKGFPVYKVVNGHPVKMHVCQGCASQVVMHEYQDYVWQSFLQSVFHTMSMDKVLTPEEMEYALATIKNKEDLNDFFAGLQSKQESHALPPCPMCQTTLNEILQTGKPGCHKCYKHYYDFLGGVIKRVQEQATQHQGKKPKNIDMAEELESLEQQMALAVKEERYEDAAKFRDKINGIKSSSSNQSDQQGQ